MGIVYTDVWRDSRGCVGLPKDKAGCDAGMIAEACLGAPRTDVIVDAETFEKDTRNYEAYRTLVVGDTYRDDKPGCVRQFTGLEDLIDWMSSPHREATTLVDVAEQQGADVYVKGHRGLLERITFQRIFMLDFPSTDLSEDLNEFKGKDFDPEGYAQEYCREVSTDVFRHAGEMIEARAHVNFRCLKNMM